MQSEEVRSCVIEGISELSLYLRGAGLGPHSRVECTQYTCCNCCTLYCSMQHVSYGFTCGWNRMAECRSWLFHPLVEFGALLSMTLGHLGVNRVAELFAQHFCKHAHFDIWPVSLLKEGNASQIPLLGQKWQRKPCQRQTLVF